MLASFPASMLNQKPSDLGTLDQFKLYPSRSSAPAPCSSAEAETKYLSARAAGASATGATFPPVPNLQKPSLVCFPRTADGLDIRGSHGISTTSEDFDSIKGCPVNLIEFAIKNMLSNPHY